ncbi:hypothetical protein JZ751_013441, partial [Albula glossodonta]
AINCTELVNLLQWYYLPTMYSLEFCLGQLGNLLVILGYIFCLKECLLVQNLKRAYIITHPIVFAHSVVNPAFYFLLGDRFWELLLGRLDTKEPLEYQTIPGCCSKMATLDLKPWYWGTEEEHILHWILTAHHSTPCVTCLLPYIIGTNKTHTACGELHSEEDNHPTVAVVTELVGNAQLMNGAQRDSAAPVSCVQEGCRKTEWETSRVGPSQEMNPALNADPYANAVLLDTYTSALH